MKKTLPDCEKTTSRLWQRFSFILYTAAAVALLLRLITAWQIAHGEFATSIFAPSPATDLRTYMNLAEQIADGKFSGPFYYQPFYYSVFLVLIRWISGGSVKLPSRVCTSITGELYRTAGRLYSPVRGR